MGTCSQRAVSLPGSQDHCWALSGGTSREESSLGLSRGDNIAADKNSLDLMCLCKRVARFSQPPHTHIFNESDPEDIWITFDPSAIGEPAYSKGRIFSLCFS